MGVLDYVAKEWYGLVCRDEFAEYRDAWICDEIFFQHLKTHKPNLKHHCDGEFSRETLVRTR